jgi:hypothetical protein
MRPGKLLRQKMVDGSALVSTMRVDFIFGKLPTEQDIKAAENKKIQDELNLEKSLQNKFEMRKKESKESL